MGTSVWHKLDLDANTCPQGKLIHLQLSTTDMKILNHSKDVKMPRANRLSSFHARRLSWNFNFFPARMH